MIWKHKLVRAVISSWAIALAVSVAPVYSAGNGGEQSNPEPDNGGGYCIDCNVDRN